MRKVLVTGGAGFIGSHLCEALLKRGDEVFVIDDLSTGRLENTTHLQDSAAFHLTLASILDLPQLEPLIKKADLVFHLAAVVGVQKIIDAPVETVETNVLGTHNVLALAARHRKPVLLTSTSEVYGKSAKYPFTEDGDVVYGPTTKTRWSYACSKAIDEFLALAYHKERNLPVVVARLFNTTGPRQTGRYGMVLPRFVDQALRDEPITVFGTGRQTRCFVDVSDVVRALLLLSEHPKAVGQVFNVGNPEEVSMYKLAQVVRKLVGSRSEICLIPYDEAYQPGFEDMERRVPSIEKISRLVAYRPTVGLREIVHRVIASRRQEVTIAGPLAITVALQPHRLRADVVE
jgi:nucleoside-diphosphate-sugar epimerase